MKANEKLIKETNAAFAKGNSSWYDSLYPFANLPDNEFLADKTGAMVPTRRGYYRGLLDLSEEDRYDEASERYFDQGWKFMSCSHVKSWVNLLTCLLIGCLPALVQPISSSQLAC